MKRITLLAAGLALLLTAKSSYAQEADPNVTVAGNANVALVACIKTMTESASGMSSDGKAMMVMQAPRMCREVVLAPSIKQGPTAGQMAWDFGKFFVQAWAGYKGQALVWGAVTSLVERGFDATENTASQGLSTAETLGVTGMDYASKPPLVITAMQPLATPAAPAVGAVEAE